MEIRTRSPFRLLRCGRVIAMAIPALPPHFRLGLGSGVQGLGQRFAFALDARRSTLDTPRHFIHAVSGAPVGVYFPLRALFLLRLGGLGGAGRGSSRGSGVIFGPGASAWLAPSQTRCSTGIGFRAIALSHLVLRYGAFPGRGLMALRCGVLRAYSSPSGALH